MSVVRILACVLAFACSSAHAFGNDALRGISKVGVTVEELPPEAARCGISKWQVKGISREVLLSWGIRIEDDPRTLAPWLYVHVHVMEGPGLCFLAMDASLYLRVDHPMRPMTSVKAQLWSNAKYGIADYGHAPSLAHKILEDLVGSFGAAVHVANPHRQLPSR